jgi:hypothetical protein
MSHYLTSDDKYRDLIYDDDYRSYLVAARGGDYRFGRVRGKRLRVQAGRAFGRLNGALKTMIEAIANAKLRRMERELELRGIRLHRSDDRRTMRDARAADGSR